MTFLGLLLPDSPMCPNNGTIVTGDGCSLCGVNGDFRHRRVPIEALKEWRPVQAPPPRLSYAEVRSSLEGQDLEDALQLWLVDLESPLLQQALLAVEKTARAINRDRRAERRWAHRLAKDMFGQAD